MATTPHELHALLTEARSRMVAVVPPEQPGMEIDVEVCRVCGGPNGHAPGCVVAVVEELIERIAPAAPEPQPAAIPGLRIMPNAYGLPSDFEVVEVGTTEKYTALQAEQLTPATFTKLVEWLREDPMRPAARAFTAGIERQIGYVLELDVIPELKRLRAAAAADKARIEGLQAQVRALRSNTMDAMVSGAETAGLYGIEQQAEPVQADPMQQLADLKAMLQAEVDRLIAAKQQAEPARAALRRLAASVRNCEPTYRTRNQRKTVMAALAEADAALWQQTGQQAEPERPVIEAPRSDYRDWGYQDLLDSQERKDRNG